VISVIVYGRNDAHGYNLHRRAALSLNCIAEVLTDPDDEIIFVDYNTSDELPTFVEALSDTLTDRCLRVLRVLRVAAAVHQQRFATSTHLSAIEPVARNTAARRANAANRWLLSTNTDMILLPRSDLSLSEICHDLPDGFYGLPRFELPEWVWEQLPRTDPSHALAKIGRLGPSMRLDEPTVSHEWIGFDAPGDFQLVLRDDFDAIDGFDERMLLGYHVDSNLSRRLFLHRGSLSSLGEQLAGYHCNHDRIPTVYHGVGRVTNDLKRFFFSVDRAELSEQRAIWGLADIEIEEVSIRERLGTRFANAVVTAIPNGCGPCAPTDAVQAPHSLTYDSGHVLPFVADSLVVSPPHTTVGYVGANPVLKDMLDTLVGELGLGERLAVANLEDERGVDDLDQVADVIVVDLGVDASLVETSPHTGTGNEAVPFRAELDRVFAALQRLVQLEHTRLAFGQHPRRVVLVNSAAEFWNGYVLTELNCSYTTVHSRVRRATVKPPTAGQTVTASGTAEDIVVSTGELRLIELYRRRNGFRKLVETLIRVGIFITHPLRLSRKLKPVGDDKRVPSVESIVASPKELRVLYLYRRHGSFRKTIASLIRVGAVATRAGRAARLPLGPNADARR
jgi:hypothetical protein